MVVAATENPQQETLSQASPIKTNPTLFLLLERCWGDQGTPTFSGLTKSVGVPSSPQPTVLPGLAFTFDNPGEKLLSPQMNANERK
jgi:hypothetical protein